MLKVTVAGVEAILQMMQAEGANGLRLHVGSRRFAPIPAIQIEAAMLPEADDVVLEVGGARLYLDPETHKTVDDQVLDADLSGDQPVFMVYEQSADMRARLLDDEGSA